MSRRSTPSPRLLNRYSCPTCGQHYGWVRVRKGGITRVPANRMGPLSTRRRGGEPRDSTRVYWPQRYGFAHCPDAWHRRSNTRWRPWEPEEKAKALVGVNTHAPAAELRDRRKERARQHRDRQSKGRR